MIKNKLTFAKGNAKLDKDTAIFSLPAGHTCPAALLCSSRANRTTGKLKDGSETLFRCYAASAENLFPNVRKSRWNNFEALKNAGGKEGMFALINASLPRRGVKLCRIHASGDFFSQAYFDAWLNVAIANPDITFYAYIKMLPLWIARLAVIPKNFKLVASRGGQFDKLIAEHNLRNVTVVSTEAEAGKLPIDHDDTQAWKSNGNFALLLHGTQPAGSAAAKAVYVLRKQNLGGYQSDYFKSYGKTDSLKAVAATLAVTV